MNTFSKLKSSLFLSFALIGNFAIAQNDDVYFDPNKDKPVISTTDYTQQYDNSVNPQTQTVQTPTPAANYDKTDGYSNQNSNQGGSNQANQYSGSNNQNSNGNYNNYNNKNYNGNSNNSAYFYDDDYLYTSQLRRYYMPNYGMSYSSNYFTPAFYWGPSYHYNPCYSYNPWMYNNYNMGYSSFWGSNFGFGGYGMNCGCGYGMGNMGYGGYGMGMYSGYGMGYGMNPYGYGMGYGGMYGYGMGYGYNNYYTNNYYYGSSDHKTSYSSFGPRHYMATNGGNTHSRDIPRAIHDDMGGRKEVVSTNNIPREGIQKPREISGEMPRSAGNIGQTAPREITNTERPYNGQTQPRTITGSASERPFNAQTQPREITNSDRPFNGQQQPRTISAGNERPYQPSRDIFQQSQPIRQNQEVNMGRQQQQGNFNEQPRQMQNQNIQIQQQPRQEYQQQRQVQQQNFEQRAPRQEYRQQNFEAPRQSSPSNFGGFNGGGSRGGGGNSGGGGGGSRGGGGGGGGRGRF